MFQKQLYVQKLHKIKPRNTYKVYNTPTQNFVLFIFFKLHKPTTSLIVDNANLSHPTGYELHPHSP